MRLIDADKLKQELKVNGLGYQYYMLDNAPTVKAIPVEWLKEHAIEYGCFIFSLNDMIKDWKKENEENI